MKGKHDDTPVEIIFTTQSGLSDGRSNCGYFDYRCQPRIRLGTRERYVHGAAVDMRGAIRAGADAHDIFNAVIKNPSGSQIRTLPYKPEM